MDIDSNHNFRSKYAHGSNAAHSMLDEMNYRLDYKKYWAHLGTLYLQL